MFVHQWDKIGTINIMLCEFHNIYTTNFLKLGANENHSFIYLEFSNETVLKDE